MKKILATILFPCLLFAITDYEMVNDIGTNAKMISIGNIEGFSESSVATLENPAALYKINNLSSSLFTTTFLNAVKYNAYSIAKQSNWGTFGLGYMSKQIGDIPHTFENQNDTFQPAYQFKYSNSTISLSYQNSLSTLLKKFNKKNNQINLITKSWLASPLITQIINKIYSKKVNMSSLNWLGFDINEYIVSSNNRNDNTYIIDYLTILPNQNTEKPITRLETVELLNMIIYNLKLRRLEKNQNELFLDKQILHLEKNLSYSQKISKNNKDKSLILKVNSYQNGYLIDTQFVQAPIFDLMTYNKVKNKKTRNILDVNRNHSANNFIINTINNRYLPVKKSERGLYFLGDMSIKKSHFLIYLSKLLYQEAKKNNLFTDTLDLKFTSIEKGLNEFSRKKIAFMYQELEIKRFELQNLDNEISRKEAVELANRFNYWLQHISKKPSDLIDLQNNAYFITSKEYIYDQPSFDSNIIDITEENKPISISNRSVLKDNSIGNEFWYQISLGNNYNSAFSTGWIHGSSLRHFTISDLPALENTFINTIKLDQNTINKIENYNKNKYLDTHVLEHEDKELNNIYIGSSIKYYNHSIDTVTGTGYNMDLGLLFIDKNISISGIVKNTIPGTKMTYSNKGVENIPIHLLLSGLYKLNNLNIYAQVRRTKRHLLYSGGLSYIPAVFNYIDLSIGYKAYPVLNEVNQNLTFGLGLHLYNIRFNYAQELSEHIIYKNKHYFSLSINY